MLVFQSALALACVLGRSCCFLSVCDCGSFGGATVSGIAAEELLVLSLVLDSRGGGGASAAHLVVSC